MELQSQKLEVGSADVWNMSPYTANRELRVTQETVCKRRLALDFLWSLFRF